MFLPPDVYFKIPMIPAFDKASIPNLAALVGCLIVAPRRVKFVKQIGLAEVLIFILIFSPVVTSMENTDDIQVRGAILPGVGVYDGLSAALSQFMVLIPFFLGRQFLRTREDMVEIFRLLVAAGLIYSLPMLFELRIESCSQHMDLWLRCRRNAASVSGWRV